MQKIINTASSDANNKAVDKDTDKTIHGMMKDVGFYTLWYSPTSPFARQVRIVIAILQLKQCISHNQIRFENVNPLQDDTRLRSVSPVARVPTLELPNSDVLIDSNAICDYLIQSYGPCGLISSTEMATQERQILHLAHAMMETEFAWVMENNRPEEDRSEYWQNRRLTSVLQILKHLDQCFEMTARDLALKDSVNRTPGSVSQHAAIHDEDAHSFNSLEQIALACALGYLDLRMDSLRWRERAPTLALWFSSRENLDVYLQTGT